MATVRNVEMQAASIVHRFLMAPAGERVETLEGFLNDAGVTEMKRRIKIYKALLTKVHAGHATITLQLLLIQTASETPIRISMPTLEMQVTDADLDNPEVLAAAVIHHYLKHVPGNRLDSLDEYLEANGVVSEECRDVILKALVTKVQTGHDAIALELIRANENVVQISLPFGRSANGQHHN